MSKTTFSSGLVDEISRKSKAKGKAEGRAEVAKSMKARNMPVCDIVELTGLTEEEISKL